MRLTFKKNLILKTVFVSFTVETKQALGPEFKKA